MLHNDAQHEQDLQRIRGFRLIDDDFMNACFDGNIKATELLLKVILGKSDIQVNKVTTQKQMKNLLGRDIWLDIDAISDGTEYNIEVQRSDKGAGRKRARYHSSIIDAHAIKPAEDFELLPESYVIFITENDVLGDGLPIYEIDRTIRANGKLFADGEHIIYVNGENKDSGTQLGKLMHDFFCTNADDMNYPELAERVRYFKENEEGVRSMCKVLEEMRNDVREETTKETTVEHIKNIMDSFGVTIEKAMDSLKIPNSERATYTGLINNAV